MGIATLADPHHSSSPIVHRTSPPPPTIVATSAQSRPVPDLWHPTINPWWIAGTVMLATFMEVLDTSIANVALPHIAGSLSAGIDESTWVLTSYLVANAIVLPLTGWFSRIFGRKRFYMACVFIFIVSSLLCGLAPSLPLLVFFRVLQGAGGGGLQPVSQAILVESFPREKQGMAMAIYGMGVVVAPIIGPTLGGWITDNYSWRWIFFINLPVGLLSVLPHRRARLRSASSRAPAKRRTRSHRLYRPRPSQRRPRFSSSRSRQGPARRLVQLTVHRLVHHRHRHWPRRRRRLGASPERSHHRIASLQGPQLRRSHLHHVRARHRSLRHHRSACPFFFRPSSAIPRSSADLVLSPGAIVTLISMPIIGRLLVKQRSALAGHRWPASFLLSECFNSPSSASTPASLRSFWSG